MRRAARVDANQTAIVEALRRVGATVQPLHTIGAGCPDLLVGYRGRNILIEIKDGARKPSARKLTADEAAWHMSWSGQVCVVESIDDAILAVSRG